MILSMSLTPSSYMNFNHEFNTIELYDFTYDFELIYVNGNSIKLPKICFWKLFFKNLQFTHLGQTLLSDFLKKLFIYLFSFFAISKGIFHHIHKSNLFFPFLPFGLRFKGLLLLITSAPRAFAAISLFSSLLGVLFLVFFGFFCVLNLSPCVVLCCVVLRFFFFGWWVWVWV